MLNVEASAMEILDRKDVDFFGMMTVARQTGGEDVYQLYKRLIKNHLVQTGMAFNTNDVCLIALKMYQVLREN
jgi:hypothetical protein